MNRYAIISGLAMALSLGVGVVSADAATGQDHPLAKKQPQSYTCKDLLGTAIEYIPEVVYWHDGWNSKDKAMTEVIGEAWLPVDVDEVIVDCRANPDKKVADVTRAHRAKAAAAAKMKKETRK